MPIFAGSDHMIPLYIDIPNSINMGLVFNLSFSLFHGLMAPSVFVLIMLLFFSPLFGLEENEEKGVAQIAGSIGAIVDLTSLAGITEKSAMKQAIDDFYQLFGCRLALHVKDSGNNPVRTASAAMKLIKEKQVQAVLGLHTWEEAAFVAELSNKLQVPILSLAETSPPWSSVKWPFLVRFTRNKAMQLKSIAAIVGSWQWQRVTVIYEDIDFVSSTIIPNLSNALLEVNSVIDYQLALPPSSVSLSEDLGKLFGRQCKVFIVYTSFELAVQLFQEARQIGMMDKGYVWVTGNDITSLLDMVNSSIISSMQGIIGVKDRIVLTYSKSIPHIHSYNFRICMAWKKAYDATWAVASAINRIVQTHKHSHNQVVPLPNIGQDKRKNSTQLLETILASDFDGLSGQIRFEGGMLVSPQYIEVVNVVGKSYRELGLWSEESGFMREIENETYNASSNMRVLGQIYWPGGPWYNPNWWAPPTGSKRLAIGVPARSAFPEFVNVNKDWARGFSINVFKAVLDKLPYILHHDYVRHNGTYDSMIQEVGKMYDMVVGDTSILSERYHYVEFSEPYAEPGLVMLISARHGTSNSKAWMFMKPFTLSMWAVTAFIALYNGFVVWLIEKSHDDEAQRDSFGKQAGTWIWLSFSTLLSPNGEKPLSNLSIVTMVVWLFVTIILTSSYTASLTSMLTFQGLGSAIMDVDTLKWTNAMVGCDEGSFVVNYLVEVLGFNPKNIKQFASGDDYPKALTNREIHAAFLRVPFAKVLLAKYCNSVIITGPTFDVGGFGFAFPKGSLLIPDLSKAICELSEQGILEQLYNEMISSYNCSIFDDSSELTEPLSLSLNSFWGLFVITAVTTTVSLGLFVMGLPDVRGKIEAMYQNLRQSPWRSNSSHGLHRATLSRMNETHVTEMQESSPTLNGLHMGPHLESPENREAENSGHSLGPSEVSRS